jgi:hypothetical protein
MKDELTPEQRRAMALEMVVYQTELDKAEAGPTAPYSIKTVRGILIESRWDILREFDLMTSVVNSLSPLVAARIKSIWCDTKCGSFFFLKVRAGRYAPAVQSEVRESLLRLNGGYNGVVIEEETEGGELREITTLAPDWGEDEFLAERFPATDDQTPADEELGF